MEQKEHVSATARKSSELAVEDLDVVSGGATQNRWNPEVCNNYSRTHYNCVGFLAGCWCDHYERAKVIVTKGRERYYHECRMGRFNYEADVDGN